MSDDDVRRHDDLTPFGAASPSLVAPTNSILFFDRQLFGRNEKVIDDLETVALDVASELFAVPLTNVIDLVTRHAVMAADNVPFWCREDEDSVFAQALAQEWEGTGPGRRGVR